jgi:hypothetical protein
VYIACRGVGGKKRQSRFYQALYNRYRFRLTEWFGCPAARTIGRRFFKRQQMNFLGYEFLLPDNESFRKTRQFLIDSPPSSNKDCLRRFIRKYGDKIDSETTAMVLAILFEGIGRHGKETTA